MRLASSSVCAIRIPLPPPPAEALIITGKPSCDATCAASLASEMTPRDPGSVLTPASAAIRLLCILSPIARIALGGGPRKATPAASTASANGAFSERNP